MMAIPCDLCGCDAVNIITLNDGQEVTACDACIVSAIKEHATTANPVYELSEIGDDPEWSL